MPFHSSSIQSKLLDHEYALPFATIFSKSKSHSSTSKDGWKDPLAGRTSTSAEEGLLSQPQNIQSPKSTWRYRARRSRTGLMFVPEMAICAIVGMLLYAFVGWAWGWRVFGGGRE